jgi:hypothetical protein
MVLPVRRLVQHAIAGIGFSAVVVTTAVAGLGVPMNGLTALAEPASKAIQQHAGSDQAKLSPALSLAAEQAERRAEASRSAERAKLSALAASKAAARFKALKARGKAVAAEQARLRADVARAEAKAAAAEAERLRLVATRGYLPGTTDPREIARQILKNKFGYGADQFSCFNNIIMRESMWNVHATNPSSGAYGIPQALPGSKMATVASDWRTNPATQIIWGVKYMDSRYGSPCSAWSFKRAHGWY